MVSLMSGKHFQKGTVKQNVFHEILKTSNYFQWVAVTPVAPPKSSIVPNIKHLTY